MRENYEYDMFENYSEVVMLLVKVRQQNLTEEEEEKVRSWREESPENEVLYAKVMSVEFMKMKMAQRARTDSERAYAKVKRRAQRRVRVRRFCYLSSAVASVFLLLGGWFYFDRMELSGLERLNAASEIIAEGSKAELILSSGECVMLGKGQLDSVWMHEGMEVHSTEGRVSYTGERLCREKCDTEELQYNILRVPRGGEYSVVLGDGTSVCLNSESELRYPVQFDRGERRVFLRGEGYFEVAKDSTSRFIVKAGEMEVEALGTTFNVKAYQEDKELTTTLFEGKVRTSVGKDEVILKPDESLSFDKSSRRMIVSDELAAYARMWKDNELVFKGETMEEVAVMLDRLYNVKVRFASEKVKRYRFSGVIKNNSLENVIELISLTAPIVYKKVGGEIIIEERK